MYKQNHFLCSLVKIFYDDIFIEPSKWLKLIDCEQSHFSLKICGEERKTSSHASMTVSVKCEPRFHEALIVLQTLKNERPHY